jgi:plasmid stabilization system protein ParE
MNEVDVVWLPRATEQLLSIIGSVSEDSPSAALHRGYRVTKRVEVLRVRHARQQAR